MSCQINGCRSPAEYTLEELRLLLEVVANRIRHQVGSGDWLGELLAVPVDENEMFGVVDGKRAQKNLIDQRINGSRWANPQCERKHGRCSKGGAFEKGAGRKAQVV